MYKRGVITDEISQNLEEAAVLAAEFGIEGLELRSVENKLPHEFNDEDIENVKKICAKYGMTICGLSSPCFKCAIDSEEDFRKHIEIIKGTIKTAKLLSVDRIRGFTFWKSGNLDDNLNKIVEKYTSILDILKDADMTMVIEHDPSVFAINAKELARVVEAINSPLVKALWDPGNVVYDPQGEKPFPDGYEAIKKHIGHVHLKDAKKTGDKIEGVLLGTGDVNIRGQLGALVKDGYSGWVVLETHYRIRHEIDEALLKNPKGTEFSAFAYEATRQCLVEWQRML